MAVASRRWCKDCKRKMRCEKDTMPFMSGCFLTVITLGLFLPFWLIIAMMQPYRCMQCGKICNWSPW